MAKDEKRKSEKRNSERRKSDELEEQEEEEVPPPPPPSPPPPPPAGYYSVWAEPADYDPSLHLIMTQLKEQHEGPVFLPHVTIGGAQCSDWPDAENKLKALCASTLPFTLKVKAVESGESYHQCVYLLMEKTDEVVAAHVRALECFDQLKEDSNFEEIREKYKPHMSLMYCHMTDEELDLAKAKVEAEHGKILFQREYNITHLTLWFTDVDDESCASWIRCAEFPLKEFEKPIWAQGQEKPPPPPPPEPEPEPSDEPAPEKKKSVKA